MTAFLTNKTLYLGTAFALFLIALPLISAGSAAGSAGLLWAGLVSMGVATLLLPLERVLTGPDRSPPDPED